ncbi:MAG: XisI protein [Pleurocapsa sp. SU_196_0]|nr:XisI protein [Pleurocapsa sp. SU_196_0]
MDQERRYEQLILQILNAHRAKAPRDSTAEDVVLADSDAKHYQLLTVGWERNSNAFGCVIHTSIQNDKIWIHYDGTEYGVANELLDLGVPKDEIVLAFQPPTTRTSSGFAQG